MAFLKETVITQILLPQQIDAWAILPTLDPEDPSRKKCNVHSSGIYESEGPPNSFSLSNASHLIIWYFFFLPTPCQKNLARAVSKHCCVPSWSQYMPIKYLGILVRQEFKRTASPHKITDHISKSQFSFPLYSQAHSDYP